MRPNPLLHTLGYGPEDRVVIFHADDVGMCDATLGAYAELLEVGALTSAALMVPCPAARAAAQVAAGHPHADLGVHLTITSEWDALRWGPVSTLDPRSSLLDGEGRFPRRTQDVQAQAQVQDVRAEVSAQIVQALAWGVDVTHVDSHMGALAHPKFLGVTIEEAAGRGLPAMYPRHGVRGWRAQGFDLPGALLATRFGRSLERRGLPLVDHLYMLPLHEGGDHLALTERVLGGLPPGVTHFILHPAQDTPELRAIAGDWEGRVANYRAFTDRRMPGVIARSGVHAIGYRPIRDALRAQA